MAQSDERTPCTYTISHPWNPFSSPALAKNPTSGPFFLSLRKRRPARTVVLLPLGETFLKTLTPAPLPMRADRGRHSSEEAPGRSPAPLLFVLPTKEGALAVRQPSVGFRTRAVSCGKGRSFTAVKRSFDTSFAPLRVKGDGVGPERSRIAFDLKHPPVSLRERNVCKRAPQDRAFGKGSLLSNTYTSKSAFGSTVFGLRFGDLFGLAAFAQATCTGARCRFTAGLSRARRVARG